MDDPYLPPSRTDKSADNNVGIKPQILTKTVYPTQPTNPGSTIAERLYYSRNIKHLLLKELSEKATTCFQAISNVEHGKTKFMRPETLKRIASVLNVSPIWLAAYDTLPEDTIPKKIYKARMYRLCTIDDAAKFFACSNKTYILIEKGERLPDSQKLGTWLSTLRSSD
jgi:transcriptional regulator with XRE-family HTH domain